MPFFALSKIDCTRAQRSFLGTARSRAQICIGLVLAFNTDAQF